MAKSTEDILAAVFQQGSFTGTLDPIRMVIWAGLEDIIRGAQMSGLVQLGRAIGAALPGDTVDEKLESFELGSGNRVEVQHPAARGRLVLLRRDIFGAVDCCMLPWSNQTIGLLRRYNEEMPNGGGALHPLHIVQHEVHRRLGNVVDIGSHDVTTGQIALSRHGLGRSGVPAEDATRILRDGAVLYEIFQ